MPNDGLWVARQRISKASDDNLKGAETNGITQVVSWKSTLSLDSEGEETGVEGWCK